MRIKLRNQAMGEKEEVNVKARLLKLTISAFKATLPASQRFWSPFLTETNHKNMPSITNLSQFIKLTRQSFNKRDTFHNLGTCQSKSYLLYIKFGRFSEVANAPIQAILSSPTAHLYNRHSPTPDIKKVRNFL